MAELVTMDALRSAIAKTTDVPKLKEMDRQIEGMKRMFAQTAKDQAEIVLLRVDLGIKIGELLGPPKPPGERGQGRRKKQLHDVTDSSAQRVADTRYRAMARVMEMDQKWDGKFRAELKAIIDDPTKKVGKSGTDSKRTPTEYSARGMKLARRAPSTDGDEETSESIEGNTYYVTGSQEVIPCHALITDPPYGILDEEWEPKQLKEFTVDWAERWNECDAHFIAVFFSQRWMWDARKWFDKAFSNYAFQQLLVWVYQNNKSPQSRKGFKQTWEPVFFYRRKDTDREVDVGEGEWGGGLNDFDTHVAAVPQSNFVAANEKRHPAQKPVSAMRWLINALTEPDEIVVDPFCGSGTTGIAAIQLGRNFHGIEISKDYRKLAEERIAHHGNETV